MQHSGSAHLGVQEFAAHAVSLAYHTLQVAEPNLLGHVYCPDACASAQVENASFSVLWHGSLVQHVSPCYGEQLVVDVHAVLLRLQCASELVVSRARIECAHLVARILVDASPVAMVVAAIFEVITVVSGHGQSAASVSRLLFAVFWP